MRRLMGGVGVTAVLATAALAAACAKYDKDGNPFVDSAKLAPPAPIDSGTYTVADFQRLRWLEGRWRGFMPDGQTFYESYQFRNDSTIVKHGYPDSTFAAPGDSSNITLRKGTVANESRSGRWVATRLDSIGADFAPQRAARNHFTWAREDASKWNASLRWTDDRGRPQNVMYALHRFGR